MKRGQSVEDSTLLSEVTGHVDVPEIDSEISVEEIENTQKRMKDYRASGDGLAKKMLTSLPVCVLYVIQIIYNSMLTFHMYPTKWRTTVVNEIFKNKGETKHATNYRAISLVALLSKVFDLILMNRFVERFIPNDSQTAYQPKKSSADHVFLLQCLVQQANRHSYNNYGWWI